MLGLTLSSSRGLLREGDKATGRTSAIVELVQIRNEEYNNNWKGSSCTGYKLAFGKSAGG